MTKPILRLPTTNSERVDIENPIRVLHVDDETGFLGVSKQILEMQGPFQVDSATSVKEAHAKMRKNEYDIVVSDYQMPMKDGLQFLKELRINGNNIPFILFTGKGREEVAIEALNLGADYYTNKLGKPETVYGELAHSIRQVVEKQRSERMFEESEERFRLYVENSPVAVFVANPEGKYEYTNDAASKLFGYSTKELLEMSIPQVCFKEDLPAILEDFASLQKTGRVLREYQLKKKDGQPVYVNLNAVRLPNGKLIAFCENITARKEATEKIREIKESYERLTDNADEAIFRVNAEGGHVIYLNKAAERIFGYSKAEWYSDPDLAFKIIHPDYQERQKKIIEEVNATKKPIKNVSLGWIAKDGHKILMEYTIIPVTDEKGKVIYFESIGRDVSERRKAEEDIRELSQFQQSIIDNADVWLNVLDDKGNILVWNKAAEKISGYSKEEVIGHSKIWAMVYPDEKYRKEIFSKYMEIVSGGEVVEDFETQIRCKNGENRTIAWNSRNLLDNEGNPLGSIALGRDVTDRKKAEEELRFLIEFNEGVVDSIGDALLVVNPNDYTIMTANEAVLEQLKLRKEDLIGKTCYEMTHHRSTPCEPPRDVCPVQEMLKTGKVVTVEHTHFDKDNNEVYVEVSVAPIRDQEGNIVQVVHFARDITERKKVEEDLRSSEDRLRILFEFAPDAYYLNDLKGNFVDGNRAAEELTGYTREELIGKSFLKLKLLSRRQIPKAAKLLTKNVFGKPTGPDEFVLNRKDGTKVPVEIRTFPVKIKGRTLVLGIARDITERKKSEEEIKNLAKFPTENPNPVLRIAKDGTILFSNKTAQSLVNERKRAEKQHIIELIQQSVLASLRSGLPKEVEVKLEDKIFSFVFAPVVESGYVNVYGRDITGRKKVEEAMNDAFDDLSLVNEKLNVVGRLTRHDVRNKLSAVTGNIYLAKQALPPDSESVKYLKETESAVDQIELIFDRARTYEHLGVEDPSYVDVGKSFDAAISLLPDLGKIEVVNSCRGLSVLADSLVGQLFFNLMDNSLKHGERVNKIRIYCKEGKDGLKLIYEDDGIGIPKAEKEKIFNEGYGKGTGVGLHMLKLMCNVYGWAIKETGKQGKGAQFTITIPETNPKGKASYRLL